MFLRAAFLTIKLHCESNLQQETAVALRIISLFLVFVGAGIFPLIRLYWKQPKANTKEKLVDCKYSKTILNCNK